MRFYECHYVRQDDPGDLLWGYNWRRAILVDEGNLDRQHGNLSPSAFEEQMFDAVTGENVGDTRNFCVDPFCTHPDCGPLTLIAEC